MKRTIRTCLGVVTAALIVGTAAAERPPNIVLLIGDDHGYPYYGFMGDENVVTPSMDALAAGGVTFSHGHVTASYCRPSLRTLITGLHPVQYVHR
ncbi:MAG: sulfatase-like hydrolase/transferase, partial [Gammaproteobacteria bacterium]|nr:sulfatase-like hydrolase/transferase [Gammaproteobacteria bacterium]